MSKELTNRPAARMKAMISQETVQEQFKNALGRRSDLFVASLIDVYTTSLSRYEPGLVVQEALKAAVLRLPISKSLGFAYIVPYGGTPQFQIGYKGLIQLAMRTGRVKSVNAGVIYEGEWVSTDKIRGVYDFSGKRKSEEVVGYFAYLELTNGFEKTLYWTKEEVTKHAKKFSKNYNSQKSVWKINFDAMSIKTLLIALFGKYSPLSIEDHQVAMSGAGEEVPQEPKDITPPEAAPPATGEPADDGSPVAQGENLADLSDDDFMNAIGE